MEYGHENHNKRKQLDHNCNCPQCLIAKHLNSNVDCREDAYDYDDGDYDDEELDEAKVRRRPTSRRRRKKRHAGPCSCAECMVDAEAGYEDDEYDGGDMDDEDFDEMEFDLEFDPEDDFDEDYDDDDMDDEDYDNEKLDEAKVRRRPPSRRRRKKRHAGPCSCAECMVDAEAGYEDDEYDEDMDDEDMDDEDFDEMEFGFGFDSEDDFDEDYEDEDMDDEDYDDEELDEVKTRRRPASRRRRKKSQAGPCSCAQCMVDAEAGYEDDEYDEDMDDEDMDDEDFDEMEFGLDFGSEGDFDEDYDDEDMEDEDYDDEELDEAKVRRRPTSRRRRKKRHAGPCSCAESMVDAEAGYEDDEYDDEDMDDEDFDGIEFGLNFDSEDDFDEDYDDEDMEDEDYDEVDNDYEFRTIRRKSPGVKRIRVRKNRKGEEPFSEENENFLRNAARVALQMAKIALAEYNKIWHGKGKGWGRWRKRRRAFKRNPLFVKYFGRRILNWNQLWTMERRIERIKRYLDRGVVFVINQHSEGRRSWGCKKGARPGFTEEVNPSAYEIAGRVFLCPEFFQTFGNDSTQRLQERKAARVIIHELVHKMGFMHARIPWVGNSYSESFVLRLAKEYPRRARRNPDNYEYLYEALYLKEMKK